MSIFYSKVPGNVQSTLDLRKRIAAQTSRTSADYAWLYRKMAYVDAYAVNENSMPKRSAALITPKDGGISDSVDGNRDKQTLYTSNANAKFIPKPHINSFKTNSDGDWGSLQKCELSFTVYTLVDLDSYQAFFDLGASLIVNYGWHAGGAASGRPGKFEGLIYNFSYSVRPDGGFDCITYAISKGSVILPVNITAGADLNIQTTDGLGQIVDAVTIIDAIQANATANPLNEGFINKESGIGYAKINVNVNLEDTSSQGITSKEKQEYYITLEALVNLINKNLLDFSKDDATDQLLAKTVSQGDNPYNIKLQKLSQPDPSLANWEKNNVPANLLNQTPPVSVTPNESIKIICNETYTRGIMPKNDKDLLSGNPLEVIFPGFATYGSVTYFSVADEFNEKFRSGDLSKTLLNFNWIKKIINSIGQETQDRQKSADASITKFLLTIFNSISDNSGTRFKLSLTSDPDDSSRFIISDINYIDAKVVPYTITAVNNQSIVRNISLVSKVPTAMATVAFVSGRSTKTTPSTVVGNTFNKNATVPDAAKIDSLRTSVENLARLVGNTEGVSSENVRRLQAALKELFEFTPINSTYTKTRTGVSEQYALPFPIDFSATLDGISGFKFGNTITTNYLPSIYKNTNFSFTITKIDHVIQNNDWTTTLSTICRAFPDDKAENTYQESDNAVLKTFDDSYGYYETGRIQGSPNVSDVPEGAVFQ
jgi:hypothetical protein